MKNTRAIIIGIIAIIGTAIFFLVPFVFIFLTASKPLAEANLLQFSWPEQFALFDNLRQALQTRDYLLVIAYVNSFILTIVTSPVWSFLPRWLPTFGSVVPAGLARSSVSWCWPA